MRYQGSVAYQKRVFAVPPNEVFNADIAPSGLPEPVLLAHCVMLDALHLE